MESFFHLPDICLTVSPAFFGDGLIHLIVDFPQDDSAYPSASGLLGRMFMFS